MKKIIVFIVALVSSVSVFAQVDPVLSTGIYNRSFVMNHRALNNCENDSCYIDLTRLTENDRYGYGTALTFGQSHTGNQLSVVTVVDEIGFITEAEASICSSSHFDKLVDQEIYSTKTFENFRNHTATSRIQAKEGQCYLAKVSSSTSTILVSFVVTSIDDKKSIIVSDFKIFELYEKR